MPGFKWLFRRDPPERAGYLFSPWTRRTLLAIGILVAYSQFVRFAFLHAVRIVDLGVDTTAHWMIERPVFVPLLFWPGGRPYWETAEGERIPIASLPLPPDMSPLKFVVTCAIVALGSAGFFIAARARTSWMFPRTVVVLSSLVGLAMVPAIQWLLWIAAMLRAIPD